MGTRLFLAALFLVYAIGATAADQTAAQDAAGAPPDKALDCRTDKDCPVMACGPCTPGTPITKAMSAGPSCAVNPCLDASAVCNAQHHCEIGPGTRKNPAVWKKPPH
ncbi:MAG TPA: hypothetical protein VH375_05070 [Rhodanobacteraceae bacterium]|jgi:hypothetical protein